MHELQMTKYIEELLNYYSRHVEFLGEPIKNVTQVGIFGSQVLHLAAFRGRHQDIEAFLACGADINAIGDLGLTPLHYAVLGSQCDAIQLLIRNSASRDIENEFGETPLQMAQLMSNAEIKEILRESGPFEVLSTDESVIASQRWADFKKIQELNFTES
jgi:uncharacterized protein